MNYKRYIDNFRTRYVYKSLLNEKQYHFFVELNKTNCLPIGLKYRIGRQIARCGGVSTSQIYFLFSSTIQLVHFLVFFCT